MELNQKATEIPQAWLASLDGEARGFMERRSALVADVRRLAKRVLRQGWSTHDELTVKGRDGRPQSDATGRNLAGLRNAGQLAVAWARAGMPFWGASDAGRPAWRTQSDDDNVMAALPAKN